MLLREWALRLGPLGRSDVTKKIRGHVAEKRRGTDVWMALANVCTLVTGLFAGWLGYRACVSYADPDLRERSIVVPPAGRAPSPLKRDDETTDAPEEEPPPYATVAE